ncbi:hypothetical protein MANES_01G142800v8 [Manihot esculenta]|nr:hypothetical protein MANES_01G142800v8 [Manihot esculenta]
MTIDQRETIREMDDSQLVGHSPAVAALPRDVSMVDVEVRTVATVPVADVGTIKRKRGRPPRIQGKTGPPPSSQRKKKDEEDVCFICFDGGSLVLCDRRGCPKAYHPACIKRDESFFRSKAKWNCGWHICSSCQKTSQYMCYTCTYSLCNACIKGADYVCVRGNKGFCGTCLRTIMLIENISLGSTEMVQVDFDDKTSWEYLFKVYWVYLKAKLSLTVEELTRAKNPWKGDELAKAKNYWKGAGVVFPKEASSGEIYHGYDEKSSCLNNFCRDVEADNSKRRKTKDQMNLINEKHTLVVEKSGIDKVTPLLEGTTWATKELLEFVAHMRNGDTSMLSQLDVQGLLLEYVKRNNLRDPCQKSEIVCDSRLITLFGKSRVGHFEMLKLLEYHFLIKENSPANDAVGGQLEAAGSTESQLIMGNDGRCITHKKMDERGPECNPNPDEYAAIDDHNINLLYLKRGLMENLMDDIENFQEKVVGSFVRTRVLGGDQKQDMHRLVKVVGTSKVAESYKVGSRTTDVMLEILNLDKKEVISIDGVSNQEFSEDECRRLRESIKCGLVKRLKVGEIQEKAMALQPVKVSDVSSSWAVSLPKIHADPNMDPNHESGEDAEESNEKKQGEHVRPRLIDVGRKTADLNYSLREVDENMVGNSAGKNLVTSCERNRNIFSTLVHERVDKSTWSQEGDAYGLNLNASREQLGATDDWHSQAAVQSDSLPEVASTVIPSPLSSGREQPFTDFETEKLWHYQDPFGKVHGPFSVIQLRKWNASGVFPADFRVWRINEKQDDSILLADALVCRLSKESVQHSNGYLLPQEAKVPSNDARIKCEHGLSESTDATWINGKGVDHDQKPVQNAVSVNGNADDEIVNSGELSKGGKSWASPSPSSSEKFFGSLLLQLREGHVDEKWTLSPSNADGNSYRTAEGKNNVKESDEQRERTDSEDYSSQSSGQNWGSQPINSSSSGWDSNPSFVPVAKSTDKSEQNQQIGFSDLLRQPPKHSDGGLKGQSANNKPTVCSSVPVQDSGPSWSTASSLVVGGGQRPEVAADWGSYSTTPAKPSVEEWDSNVVSASSLKPTEGDHAATPTSGTDQLTHSSPTHPAIDASSWHPIVPEPNEFCSLVDESVSDLLAEVEAMESLGGLPSPTSKMTHGGELTPGSDDDCFSPVEPFSPAPDPGKSDALSSTGDVQMPPHLTSSDELLRLSLMPSRASQLSSQMTVTAKPHHLSRMPLHSIVPDDNYRASSVPSQSTLTEEPLGLWQTGILNPQKSFSGHSPSSADTKPSDVSVNQWERRPEIQPRASSTVKQGDTGSGIRGATPSAVSQMETGSDTRRANLNRRAPQGSTNMTWGTGHGSVQQQNSSVPAVSTSNIGVGSWGSQPRNSGDNRYSSPRDHRSNYFQDRESGFGRDRSSWNRQPTYGFGNGGGSSKPQGKGQRVCKFYESGYCKKGASCSYWHP